MNEPRHDRPERRAGLWTFFAALVIVAVFLDWWSKDAAVEYHIRTCGLLAERTSIELVEAGFLRLHIVREYNRGMAFGLLQDLDDAPFYLGMIRAGAILVLVWIFHRASRKTWMLASAFAALVAGAAGNLLDNMFHAELGHEHSVRDFILLAFGDWQLPAFNAADVFVTLGAVLLLLSLLRAR